MIIEMTRVEYAVYEALSDDGYGDCEILGEIINLFGAETRVVETSLRAKMIMECVAS
jgi:hypothetical protein